MSFSIFLFGTMVASITALVALLALPTAFRHPLGRLRIVFVPDHRDESRPAS